METAIAVMVETATVTAAVVTANAAIPVAEAAADRVETANGAEDQVAGPAVDRAAVKTGAAADRLEKTAVTGADAISADVIQIPEAVIQFAREAAAISTNVMNTTARAGPRVNSGKAGIIGIAEITGTIEIPAIIEIAGVIHATLIVTAAIIPELRTGVTSRGR